jgi:hypothetical protein
MKPFAAAERRIVLAFAAACLACAPAPHEGELVHIAEESAIILWDGPGKTQHFIRSAAFQTDAKDFGFLVPTPSVPELAEADESAFRYLDRITDPPELRMMMAPAAAAKKSEEKSIEPKVVVIATARVSGMDAAVLAANDAGALDRWLKEHGYASSLPLMDWAKVYIDRNWYITAFKIASGPQPARRLEAGAVRMSFRTDQPFFPYREPQQPGTTTIPPTARLLKVYFVGDGRYDGVLETSAAWPGRPAWSASLSAEQRAELMRLLRMPADSAATSTWLTLFRDFSDPRPGGADVNFVRASSQAELRPELELMKLFEQRQQTSSLAMWAAILLAGGAVVFWIARRRKRKANHD